MKRFLLFSGQTFGTVCGWQHFTGDCDFLGPAIKHGEETSSKYFEFWHVVDTTTLQIVAKGGRGEETWIDDDYVEALKAKEVRDDS